LDPSKGFHSQIIDDVESPELEHRILALYFCWAIADGFAEMSGGMKFKSDNPRCNLESCWGRLQNRDV